MSPQTRRTDGSRSDRSSRQTRPTGICTEPLENRLIAGAMAALTPGGLSLDTPDAATDLVESALGAQSDHAALETRFKANRRCRLSRPPPTRCRT